MAQPLQPTLKTKKRYVVYEPTADETVHAAYAELFGIRGQALAGILNVDTNNNKSILRVDNKYVDQLKAAIAWAGKTPLLVSGTLRKARAAIN